MHFKLYVDSRNYNLVSNYTSLSSTMISSNNQCLTFTIFKFLTSFYLQVKKCVMKNKIIDFEEKLITFQMT